MKKSLLIITASLGLMTAGCHITKNTDALSGASIPYSQPEGNSAYYSAPVQSLETGSLEVRGEVLKPGKVSFTGLPKREVVVKEALTDKGNTVFKGAFRYSGYSLLDILQPFILDKANKEIFRPEIDAYIRVTNSSGESVAFSWSEIFHTATPHRVIIATEAAPVKPHRKEVEYDAGKKWKLVAGGDLYAFRYLEDPVSITVYSFNKKQYTITRDMKDMFAPEVTVVQENKEPFILSTPKLPPVTYNSVFYGMGMGYHEIPVFEGYPLKDMLAGRIDMTDPAMLKSSLACFVSVDGYRAVFSISELFNRADQCMPIMCLSNSEKEGGKYRIYLPDDFYADRSVKSVKEMYIFSL